MRKQKTFNCDQCGNQHTYSLSDYNKVENHFCSHNCSIEYRKIPVIQRIFNNTFHSPDGCHYWTAGVNEHGYAIISVDRKPRRVSRILYQELNNVKLHRFQFVCHSCDNPLCVNPDHFFIGSPKDNTQDMLRKGRHNAERGEGSGKSKLTNEQVFEIRSLKGKMTQSEIGLRFSITGANVCSIHKGDTWRHLL